MIRPKGLYWVRPSVSSQPQIAWQLDDSGSAKHWAVVATIAYLEKPPTVIRRIITPDLPRVIEAGNYWVFAAERTEAELAYYDGFSWCFPGDDRPYDNKIIKIIEGPLRPPKVAP